MGTSASLGEEYQPSGEHLQDPYPFYRRARQEEPVFFSPALNAWVVTRYEDVSRIVRDPDTFSSGNALRPLVQFHPASLEELQKGFPPVPSTVDSDGELHRRLRAPLARALSPERVNALEPFIRERADALIDGFVDDDHADVMARYAYPLPVQIITELLGLDEQDRAAAAEQSYASAEMISAQLSEDEQAAATREFVAFQHTIAGYVQRRRAQPRDDLVSDVVAALAPSEGELAFEQLAELVWHLIGVAIAGHTTTSAVLGNGLRHLLSDRRRWELLCERPELIPGTVEEILRYDPSVQSFFRVTTRPVSVGGVDLPPGTELMVVYGSANRDESQFERADEFDITRAVTRHLAFGGGVHLCVGSGLARKELQVSLELLSSRLPGMRLVPDQEVRVRPGLNHRGPYALLVEW
ncbi:MAG TPA: cytochrome P450 [Actinomycetes bacterium]|nr:cytochrome P450 [Actinomycetes bacterium]